MPMLSRPSCTAELGRRLLSRTLELVNIESESRAESKIAEHALAVLCDGGVPARDAGDTCVLAGTTSRGERSLALLVGHLDTVPSQGNWPGQLKHHSVVGLGASDMKGGLAVMLELAQSLARRPLGLDVGYVLFGREELQSSEGAFAPLLAREPGLQTADLAIVLEPTANTVQAGCLGNLDAAWVFQGIAGHSARPWLTESPIYRAIDGLGMVRAMDLPECHTGGLTFREVLTATSIHAGVARNVIPGSARVGINFRYAPTVSAAEAEARLRAWCELHGRVEVLSNTPGACPPSTNPLLDRLVSISGSPLEPKQAWTPIAELAAVGVEAINFGPGDPAFAHRADEQVAAEALVRTHRVLEELLCV
jgi:succinyl-diaminopimelate desuccinylase